MGVSVEARSAGALIPMINSRFCVEACQTLMSVENGESVVGILADSDLGFHVMMAMRA